MRRLGYCFAIANKLIRITNGRNREHINVYCSWKNRIQRYAFNWCPDDEVFIGDESERTECPVCNGYVFKHEFDICPVCMWQHDMVQEEEPTLAGGANKMSLNQAREAFRNGEKVL